MSVYQCWYMAGWEAPGRKFQILFSIGKLLTNIKILWLFEADFEQDMKQQGCLGN